MGTKVTSAQTVSSVAVKRKLARQYSRCLSVNCIDPVLARWSARGSRIESRMAPAAMRAFCRLGCVGNWRASIGGHRCAVKWPPQAHAQRGARDKAQGRSQAEIEPQPILQLARLLEGFLQDVAVQFIELGRIEAIGAGRRPLRLR